MGVIYCFKFRHHKQEDHFPYVISLFTHEFVARNAVLENFLLWHKWYKSHDQLKAEEFI